MNTTGNSNEAASSRFRGVAGYFAAAVTALLVLACPAVASSGDWGPVFAWALTFLPGALIVSQAARFRDPVQSVPFMILSTLFRFAVAGGGGLLVLQLVPSTPRTVFLVWLGVMYLIALAAEIYLTMSINSLWKLVRPAPQAMSSATHVPEARR